MSRCLIVTDDPALRPSMRAACRSLDSDPAEATDALVARRMVATLWPDVVLAGGAHPGTEWLRTLPQPWEEVTEIPGGDPAPAGVRVFVHAGSHPTGASGFR